MHRATTGPVWPVTGHATAAPLAGIGGALPPSAGSYTTEMAAPGQCGGTRRASTSSSAAACDLPAELVHVDDEELSFADDEDGIAARIRCDARGCGEVEGHRRKLDEG